MLRSNKVNVFSLRSLKMKYTNFLLIYKERRSILHKNRFLSFTKTDYYKTLNI